MATYDDQETKADDSVADMRRRTGISKDEEGAMDREAHNGAAQDIGERSLDGGALASAETMANEASGETEEADSESAAINAHENQIGNGIRKENSGAMQRTFARFTGVPRGKKALLGGGLFGILITIIFMAFLAFLPLKINHIVENLTNHFFASSQDAVGNRAEILMSDYLKKYVMPGMTLDGDCKTTKTITKNCVKTIDGDSPAKKLFRAWNDARFENTLANKYGVEIAKGKFQGDTGPAQYRITIDGNKFDLPNEWPAGNQNVFEAVGGRNDARQVQQKLKDAFANETLWKRVMYRFKVGRLLERKYDIRRCVFICKTKDDFADWKDAKTGQVKKNVARAILSVRALDRHTEALQLILACMVSEGCSDFKHPGADFDRQDKFETDLASAIQKLDQKLFKYTASDILKELEKFQGSSSFGQYILDKVITKFISNEAAQKGLGNLVPVLGQINTVASWIGKLQDASGHLKRWLYVAKATAMVSVFVTYRSYADETKDHKVDAALLGEMVKSLGSTAGDANHQGQPAESTPLYSELMGSKPSTTASILNVFSPTAYAQSTTPTLSKYTCQDNSHVAANKSVCPEDNLATGGIIDSVLSLFQGDQFKAVYEAAGYWNSTAGEVFSLIGKLGSLAGDQIMNLPGIKNIMDLASGTIGYVTNTFIDYIQKNVLPSPISDNPSGGSTFDAMAGGADISGNDFAQYGTGGARISDQTAADIRTKQENEARDEFVAKPFFARMFDKSSPYSFVSQVAMTMPLNAGTFFQNSFASLISEPFTKLAQAFSSLFTTRLSYAASAAADPFGVPQVGYNPNDPSLNMNPDIFTDAYCAQMNKDWTEHDIHITNYDTGTYTLSDLGTDSGTGIDVHETTNPCLLETAATGSSGALFSDDLLSKGDTTDPGQSATTTTGTTGPIDLHGGKLLWPVTYPQFDLSSCFGPRGTGFHPGIDISAASAAIRGTPVVAAADGVVGFAGPNSGYGQHFVAINSSGFGTSYGHMLSMTVNVGDTVKQGQIIGAVGDEDAPGANHLHFNVFPGAYAGSDAANVDPLQNGLVLPPGTPVEAGSNCRL